MRKNKAVSIVTLSSMALTFQACGEEEEAYCVDQMDQVVENENCYANEDRVGGGFFWIFGSGLSGKKVKKGMKIAGQKIDAGDRAALQSKGGFGSGAKSGGIGRTVSSGG